MTTIAVLSSKGGVGKTSLAIWLAQVWHDETGEEIVLADLDPQGSAAIWAEMPKAQWAKGKITVIPHPKKFNPKQKLNWGERNVIIDCPPRLDDVCLAAAFVADVVVTPVKPGQFDLHACSDTLALLDAADQHRAKSGLGPVKRIIVPNMLTQTKLSKDLIGALKPTNYCFERGLKLRAEYASVSAEGARLKRGPALHDVESLLEQALAQ